MRVDLVKLREVRGRPKSDRLEIWICKEDKDYIFLMIIVTNGQLEVNTVDEMIKVNKKNLEELINNLDTEKELMIRGEPINNEEKSIIEKTVGGSIFSPEGKI